jgi:hypothetical protein
MLKIMLALRKENRSLILMENHWGNPNWAMNLLPSGLRADLTQRCRPADA